jgi:hypothetical protein
MTACSENFLETCEAWRTDAFLHGGVNIEGKKAIKYMMQLLVFGKSPNNDLS